MARSTSISVVGSGLVTSIGLRSASACAAMRARISNPSPTFLAIDDDGWGSCHRVTLSVPTRDLQKHARMAAMAVSECLEALDKQDCRDIPILLCVAESDRVGRVEGLDESLCQKMEHLLGMKFGRESRVFAHGRAGLGSALSCARALLQDGVAPRVLVAAVDSLLNSATADHYDAEGRLLTGQNSNGILLGEAAGAVLLTLPGPYPTLQLIGLGFGLESSTINLDLPLRGDGLTTAIKHALDEAEIEFHDIAFRITDISGEHYYFKEAALAVGRLLRVRTEELEMWHPAECIGETGAACGMAMLALAQASFRKGYAPGCRALLHIGNDSGERVAAIFEYGIAK